MWLLSLLPDGFMYFIVLAIIGAGIIGYVLGSFGGVLPILKPYASPIKLGSIVVLCLGIYLYGGYTSEMVWRERVKELQVELDKKNIKSESATKEIVIKYVERVKVIKEKTHADIKEITKYITKEVDSGCIIPDDFRMLHSRASGNEVPATTAGSNDSSSGKTTGP